MVPYPDGRLILDISPLKEVIAVRPFSLPSTSDLRSLLPLSAFMAEVDLQEAYWHLPVHPRFRKFLTFRFQGKDLQFRAMPFGQSVPPFSFRSYEAAVQVSPRVRSQSFELPGRLDWVVRHFPGVPDSCSGSSFDPGRVGFLSEPRKS